jgi:hypothetical protein
MIFTSDKRFSDRTPSFLGLLLDLEDGGNVFLQKVGLSLKRTASQPRSTHRYEILRSTILNVSISFACIFPSIFK